MPAPVSRDLRKTIEAGIGYPMLTVSMPDVPRGTLTYMTVQDRDEMVDRIIAELQKGQAGVHPAGCYPDPLHPGFWYITHGCTLRHRPPDVPDACQNCGHSAQGHVEGIGCSVGWVYDEQGCALAPDGCGCQWTHVHLSISEKEWRAS